MTPAPGPARAEILRRIRTALGPAGPTATAPNVPRGYRTPAATPGAEPPDRVALVDLIEDRLRDYRAAVRRCTPDALDDVVTGLLDDGGIRDLALPPDAPADLSDWTGNARRDLPEAPLSPAELDTVDAVLTGCAVAIAETGTLVLDAAPDQGRRLLTLIPDHHIVVVHAGQIVRTVPEAVRRLRPDRPLTWISGPSATSDIELTRVEGVHGPRTLQVVLVAGAGRGRPG